MFAVAAVIGFGISFIGFEQLMAYVYPALGFLGLALAAVLAVGYLREWPNISKESERRIQIRALFTRRLHPEQTFTQSDAHELETLVDESPMDNEEMTEAVAEEVMAELEADASVDFSIAEDAPDGVDPLTPAEIAELPMEAPDEDPTQA